MLYDFMFTKDKPYYNTMLDKMDSEIYYGNQCLIDILTDYRKRFDKYVLADEKMMSELIGEYEKKISDLDKEEKKFLKKLFVDLYTSFTQDETAEGISVSHSFFHELNIRTCPYCNRQYTFTTDTKGAKTAPEYDHFYDKSHYPILAVSFYNLIPSCHTCNHIKGTKNTAKVNPYFRGFESCFRLVNEKNQPEITGRHKEKLVLLKPDGTKDDDEQGNIDTFGLQELYAMHDDYIKELVEKATIYNSTFMQDLVSTFQSAAHSQQEVFDFIWGKYLEVSQYENRPLAKLTKDLLDQLGIRR